MKNSPQPIAESRRRFMSDMPMWDGEIPAYFESEPGMNAVSDNQPENSGYQTPEDRPENYSHPTIRLHHHHHPHHTIRERMPASCANFYHKGIW